MLNRAARYFPILRTLKQENLLSSSSVLEIGSGPIGLGEFRKVPFIGSDIVFPEKPHRPMIPLICSASALPFPDGAFDVVIASDVMEHVPAKYRGDVVRESLRVARNVAIFGFPCGSKAQACDRMLKRHFVRRGFAPPGWLKEHMDEKFPTPDLFSDVTGWEIAAFGNENIYFHLWMMRMEMRWVRALFMQACLRLAPPLFEFLLRKFDSPPYYRQIFVLKRKKTA